MNRFCPFDDKGIWQNPAHLLPSDQENGISEFVHQSCFRLDFHADDNHGFCPGVIRPGYCLATVLRGFGEDYFTDAILTQDNGILAAIRPLSDDGDLEGMTVEESSGWVIKYHEDMSIQWQKHFGYTDCFRTIYKLSELVNGDIIIAGSTGSISGTDCIDEIGGSDFSSSKPTHSAMNSGTKPMAAPTGIF